MTTPQPTTSPRKRRWFQFSLRTLMIVMLLASIGMSWFAVKLQQARRQRETVEAIREVGGWVRYDYENDPSAEPPGPTWLRERLGIDFFARPVVVVVGDRVDDALLKQIAALPPLEALDVFYAGVTDEGVPYLPQLRHLKELRLRHNTITDNGLAHLAQLSQLQMLCLSGNKITGDGLAHLASLPQLEGLDLDDNEITDEGLAHLPQLSQLRFLSLTGNKITGDGLAHLAQLPQLESLTLSDEPITDAGLKRLKKLNRLRWPGRLSTA